MVCLISTIIKYKIFYGLEAITEVMFQNFYPVQTVPDFFISLQPLSRTDCSSNILELQLLNCLWGQIFTRVCLDVLEKGKISWPYGGSNHGLFILLPSHYTKYAILVPCMICIECNPNVKVGFKMHVEIICLKMTVIINYIYCFQNVILF